MEEVKWRDPGDFRVLWRNATQGDATSPSVSWGFLGISVSGSSEANLTQEADEHTRARLRTGGPVPAPEYHFVADSAAGTLRAREASGGSFGKRED